MIFKANVFPKLHTVKGLIRPSSKKSRFGPPFNSQYVNGMQTLLKSAWENFYHIFSSLCKNLIWKMYILGKSEACLLTQWQLMTSILFGIVRVFCFQFKCNYLKNEKFFSIFCSITEIYIKF